jgi:hypothetical protein
MIDIDLSEFLGPPGRALRRPNRALPRHRAAIRDADELLNAYSSWLFFERHFLHIGRFGVAKALGMIDTVVTDNVGAAFRLPSARELPDYAGPGRRAALVLAAAGLQIDGLARLTPEVR